MEMDSCRWPPAERNHEESSPSASADADDAMGRVATSQLAALSVCAFGRRAAEPLCRGSRRTGAAPPSFLAKFRRRPHTVQQFEESALGPWTLLMPPKFGRSVSPGLASRLAVFGGGDSSSRTPESSSQKPSSKASPRRAISPRLRERVDSFGRRAMREEDVTRDAPVVRGVNDRPRARPWLGQAAQAVSSTVAPARRRCAFELHARALERRRRRSSSMSGTGVVPPPLSLGGLNKNPMGWNGPAMSATGNANVDHQRDWLNQQLAEIGSGRSDASSIRPGSTRGSPRPTGGASASSSSMSGGLYPLNGQEGGTGGAGGAGAAQPSGRPMQDAATSVQAGFRGMRSRRTAREQQQQRKPQRRRTPSPPRQARTPSPTFEEAEEEEVEAVAELPPLPPPPSQQPMPVRNPNLPPPPPSVLTPAERATTSYVMAGAAARLPRCQGYGRWWSIVRERSRWRAV